MGEAVDAGTKSKHSSGPHMQDDSAGLRLNEHLRSIDARRIRITKFSATHVEVRPFGIGVEMLITRQLTMSSDSD